MKRVSAKDVTIKNVRSSGSSHPITVVSRVEGITLRDCTITGTQGGIRLESDPQPGDSPT